MRLSGLHLLLTYQCTYECDHCFVWGSPRQTGTMTLENIREILRQAKDAGTVEWIYFEGGEPLLYYPILVKGVQAACDAGFRVGLVSNCYWATAAEDAVEWLTPLAGLIQDFSLSSDLYHSDEKLSRQMQHARAAAEKLDLPVRVIIVAQPEATDAVPAIGQLPADESVVMYRGRAADKLVNQAARRPWAEFTTCPCEDLRAPERLHVDPLGNLHICQGISVGNLFRSPLKEICERYDPDTYPITDSLLAGGPAELIRRYGLAHGDAYADACHLCDEARRALRERFPEILVPDQMYGVPDDDE